MIGIEKNNEAINSKDRYKFFRDVQVWPTSDDLDFQGWLNNFGDENDYKLACIILDFFNYYPKKMVNQMLIASVGRAGYELSKHFPDWKHSDFKNRCKYTFIPGETHNPTDSGNLFMRKLRDVLEIDESRLVDFKDIHDLLEEETIPLPIIFVDDFVGSGSQCSTAWCQSRWGKNKRTLSEISQLYGHKFVYAPLLVNYEGYKCIKEDCTDLILSPSHVIGEEYNLFNPNCICWKNNISLFNSGVELILTKSRELGIPSTNGEHVNDEKGFQAQGLALAFEHGAPDAIPAFFYWCSDGWTPLIRKTYKR
jgi:hypothetical protein